MVAGFFESAITDQFNSGENPPQRTKGTKLHENCCLFEIVTFGISPGQPSTVILWHNRSVTYKQICEKVACPACAAPVGTYCGMGAGRLRSEPHPERAALANKGSFTSSKNALGNVMSMFKKR